MNRLHKIKTVSLLALLLAATGPMWIGAAASENNGQAESIADAVAKGKATLSFRYRFEHVDQDGIDKKAEASTLRTRLSLSTAEYKDFGLTLQFANVAVIGSERYNSTRNGDTEYPVVADPDGTEVNEAYLGYTPGDTAAKLGRQRIVRDNQRFIGGVAWRQNEQTFDAFTLGAPFSDLRLDYGYLWQVNRIFGPDEGIPAAEFDSDSHIFNVGFGRWPQADLRGYAYLLDLENAPAQSNSTYGLRLSGKHKMVDDKFIDYAAEYASQSDYADNPTDYTADYYLLELGGGVDAFSAKLGWEVLGGDQNQPDKAFRTPLATLHKFQGWADKFLNTPNAGIDDRYIALNAKFMDAAAALVYHKFEAESGSQKYGDEWNFSLSRTFAKRHNLLLKYADYQADTFATDTTKWWLGYFVKFP